MGTERCAPAQAAKHRQLRSWLSDVPQVLDARTSGQPPALETELIARGDRLPPAVAVAVGRCSLGFTSVRPQGTAVVATVR
jgi:hypothetical protein